MQLHVSFWHNFLRRLPRLSITRHSKFAVPYSYLTTSSHISQASHASLDSPIITQTMPKEKKEKISFQLKTPKGTRDWAGPDVLLRDRIFSTITSVFRAHGAIQLDTPVFELKDVLSGNYGEDSKLIYDLQDQGGIVLFAL